eukprot:5770671-Pleurochrysis_carterae.AAC.2
MSGSSHYKEKTHPRRTQVAVRAHVQARRRHDKEERRGAPIRTDAPCMFFSSERALARARPRTGAGACEDCNALASASVCG